MRHRKIFAWKTEFFLALDSAVTKFELFLHKAVWGHGATGNHLGGSINKPLRIANVLGFGAIRHFFHDVLVLLP